MVGDRHAHVVALEILWPFTPHRPGRHAEQTLVIRSFVTQDGSHWRMRGSNVNTDWSKKKRKPPLTVDYSLSRESSGSCFILSLNVQLRGIHEILTHFIGWDRGYRLVVTAICEAYCSLISRNLCCWALVFGSWLQVPIETPQRRLPLLRQAGRDPWTGESRSFGNGFKPPLKARLCSDTAHCTRSPRIAPFDSSI